MLQEHQPFGNVGKNDRTTMIKEINDEHYSGGHTFISDCPLDELQAMHREIVIEGNLSETFEKLNIL